MITQGQKAHFETFGFLILRQRYTPEEAERMRETVIEVIEAEEGKDALSGETYHLMPLMERNAYLTSLIDDERMHEIPETLLGPDFFLNCTDAHFRCRNTDWHGVDLQEKFPVASVRVAIYFQSLSKGNGCLRVIPGSHHDCFAEFLQTLPQNKSGQTPFGISPEHIPCVALETEPGDAVVFTESVFHASFGSKAGRLQMTAQFAANPITDDQVRELRRLQEKFNWSLHPCESFIHSDRPRVRRMVSRLVKLDFSSLPV